MMKGVIIYKSKYGSTKQYAKWLHDETKFELYKIDHFSQDLKDYDFIVFAASIHAGALSLKRCIVNTWPAISDKTVTLLVTSGAGHHEVVKKIIKESIPSEVYRGIHIFPVGGHYVFKDMSFLDRTLIKIAAFFVKNPDAKKGMLKEKREVKRENLQDLIDFIESRDHQESNREDA